MATPENTEELAMLPSALYREDVFTDRKVGMIRVLTPVTADGRMDATRKVIYTGEAQIFTPAGVLPLAFEIDAGSLAEAVANFGPSAKAAVERAAGASGASTAGCFPSREARPTHHAKGLRSSRYGLLIIRPRFQRDSSGWILARNFPVEGQVDG